MSGKADPSTLLQGVKEEAKPDEFTLRDTDDEEANEEAATREELCRLSFSVVLVRSLHFRYGLVAVCKVPLHTAWLLFW